MADMNTNRACFSMVLIPTGHYPREAIKAGTPLRDMARRRL